MTDETGITRRHDDVIPPNLSRKRPLKNDTDLSSLRLPRSLRSLAVTFSVVAVAKLPRSNVLVHAIAKGMQWNEACLPTKAGNPCQSKQKPVL
jgi:hypothetical protein